MAFLVFEGLDGAGKTTLIQHLKEHLVQRAIKVQVSREPGGTELGEELRTLLLKTKGQAPTPRCELLLYEAIRAQHVDLLIRPALEQGNWVLCDRFTASSLAFQSGGRSLQVDEIVWLNQFATGGLRPDLTILMDLTVEESDRRRENRSRTSGVPQDRFEQEARDFHERVRQNYLRQALESPQGWLVLSASQTPDSLFQQLKSELEKRRWLP